jgi:hypothetical protein
LPAKLILSLVLIPAAPAYVGCGDIAMISHIYDETILHITETPDDLNFDTVPVPSSGFDF